MTQELSNLCLKLRDLHQELSLGENQKTKPTEKHSQIVPKAWLTALSELISRIEEKLNSDEEVEILDVQLFYDQASALLADENLDASSKGKRSEAVEALHKLQPWVKNMHEMHNENERNRHQIPQ